MLKLIGIITIVFEDSVSGLILLSSLYPHSAVGFVYEGEDNVERVYLYYTIDGTVVTFAKDVALSDILNHILLRSVSIYDISVKKWKAMGYRGDIDATMSIDRLNDYDQTGKVNRVVYDSFISSINDRSSTIRIFNGYSIVNRIIRDIWGIERSHEDNDILKPPFLVRRIITDNNQTTSDNKLFYSYLSDQQESESDLTIIQRNRNNQPTVQYGNFLDGNNSKGVISNIIISFIEAYMKNRRFRSHVISLSNPPVQKLYVPREITLDDAIDKVISSRDSLSCDQETKLVEGLAQLFLGERHHMIRRMKNPMADIDSVIASVVDAMTDGGIPTLDVGRLVKGYNEIAKISECPVINIDNNNIPSSSGVFTVRRDNIINIKLKSGDISIIPSHQCDLSIYNRNELIEILRYLDSIRSSDDRFIGIQNMIVDTLAIKNVNK